MNKWIGVGRLTKDPDVRYTQNGKCVANFTIATNSEVKDSNGKYGADFHNCTAWEKTAELIGNHFTKGSQIVVEGKLKTDSYEKDGQKHYKTYVSVNRVEFCGSKGGQATTNSDPSGMGQEVFPDEEIPF